MKFVLTKALFSKTKHVKKPSHQQPSGIRTSTTFHNCQTNKILSNLLLCKEHFSHRRVFFLEQTKPEDVQMSFAHSRKQKLPNFPSDFLEIFFFLFCCNFRKKLVEVISAGARVRFDTDMQISRDTHNSLLQSCPHLHPKRKDCFLETCENIFPESFSLEFTRLKRQTSRSNKNLVALFHQFSSKHPLQFSSGVRYLPGPGLLTFSSSTRRNTQKHSEICGCARPRRTCQVHIAITAA